jgi:hypothetical protein
LRTTVLATAALTVMAGVGIAAAIGTASASTSVPSFPSASGTKTITSTITISGTVDEHMLRFVASGMGSGGQSESQKPVFLLTPGSTIENVIIGKPGVDGIHCEGTCNLINVWWEDVGEDAATLLGTASSGSVMTINGGGARYASDKVFQHNGPGTMVIENFYVDDFGKLYRSCGNCRHGYQGKRTAYVRNVIAKSGHSALVGINSNYGDQVYLSNITILSNSSLTICARYKGNNTGAEPTKVGSGPGSGCNYSSSDIHFG